MGFGLTSGATAAAAVVLLALEKATNHWFFGVYAFDVAALGRRLPAHLRLGLRPGRCCPLALGALFGTAYRAFGTKGALLTGLAAAVLVVAVTLLSASNKGDRRLLARRTGCLGRGSCRRHRRGDQHCRLVRCQPARQAVVDPLSATRSAGRHARRFNP